MADFMKPWKPKCLKDALVFGSATALQYDSTAALMPDAKRRHHLSSDPRVQRSDYCSSIRYQSSNPVLDLFISCRAP